MHTLPFLTSAGATVAGWRKNLKTRVSSPPGDRSTIVNSVTQNDLNTGPAPGRISRDFDQRWTGYSGPRQIASFPATQDDAYVIHLRVRKMTNPTLRYRTYGDYASVPAVYAGNPIR